MPLAAQGAESVKGLLQPAGFQKTTYQVVQHRPRLAPELLILHGGDVTPDDLGAKGVVSGARQPWFKVKLGQPRTPYVTLRGDGARFLPAAAPREITATRGETVLSL